MPTEYEKMIAGEFYKPSDPELRALAARSREKQMAFNAEPDRLKRAEIVKSWFWFDWGKCCHEPSVRYRLRC